MSDKLTVIGLRQSEVRDLVERALKRGLITKNHNQLRYEDLQRQDVRESMRRIRERRRELPQSNNGV